MANCLVNFLFFLFLSHFSSSFMLSQYHRLSMEALEGVGNKFNLSENVENGVKCSKELISPCLLVVAKFLTKLPGGEH